MPVTVDWAGTSIIPYQISVPKDYMAQIQPPPQEIRRLDIDVFRMTLRDLEDDPDGRPWPRTHDHETEVTLGGVIYARKVRILAPYTVTFEDGQYAVDLQGANSNIAERTNVNQVSIRSNNSAGLQTVISGSGVTEQDKLDIANLVWEELKAAHLTNGSMGKSVTDLETAVADVGDAVDDVQADTTELLARLSIARATNLDSLPTIEDQAALVRKAMFNRLELAEGSTNNWVLYDDDKVTPIFRWNVTDKSGSAITLETGMAARQMPSE